MKIGEALTTEQLIEMTANDGHVVMLRGAPGFRFVKKADLDGSIETFIEWEDLQARVIRPNMECTNGMIHVIDKVIMKKRDVTLSKSPGSVAASLILTIAAAYLVTVQ